MAVHEEFLELCAAATAGELTAAEQAKLDSHLAECAECRRAMREYELAAHHGMAALASEFAPEDKELADPWSVGKAEAAFFKRLETEEKHAKKGPEGRHEVAKQGRRFTYLPSQIRWREVWMPLAAAMLLALALGVTAYRTGLKRGTDVARTTPDTDKDTPASLEQQLSDAGHDRALLLAKLAEEDRTIADLRRQLVLSTKVVTALRAGNTPPAQNSSTIAQRDQELAAAQTKLAELQKTIDTLTDQRDEVTTRAATLEAKVSELTELVRERSRDLDRKQEEVAKQQDLLEHDRDIRELMGARDLYIAEVHDVAGTGQTDKTYG